MFCTLPCDGDVPGSIYLESSREKIDEIGVKTTRGSNAQIILSPQPSDDPSDPYVALCIRSPSIH